MTRACGLYTGEGPVKRIVALRRKWLLWGCRSQHIGAVTVLHRRVRVQGLYEVH
jgi:hypothetical protein